MGKLPFNLKTHTLSLCQLSIFTFFIVCFFFYDCRFIVHIELERFFLQLRLATSHYCFRLFAFHYKFSVSFIEIIIFNCHSSINKKKHTHTQLFRFWSCFSFFQAALYSNEWVFLAAFYSQFQTLIHIRDGNKKETITLYVALFNMKFI